MPETGQSRLDVARQSAQGSVVLFAGNLVATGALTLASIVIARLLGPNGYGGFALALTLPNILQLFAALGLNAAVTRFVAFDLARGEKEEAKRHAETALVFTLLFGLVLSAVSYLTAGLVASDLFGRPYLAPEIRLASAVVVGQALVNSAVAAAIGWNAMSLAAIANAAQAFLRLALSPLLILAGLGLFGAVGGQSIGLAVGALAAVALLYSARIGASRLAWGAFVSDLGRMLRYGLPAFSLNVSSGIWPYFLPVVLAAVATNVAIGYYQAAYNFTVAVTLVASATSSALFPAFASIQGGGGDLTRAVRLAMRYLGYVGVPVVFLLAGTAPELLRIFFGGSFVPGAPYLQLFAFAFAPILTGLTVLPVFFNGVARPGLTLAAVGIGTVTLLVTAPLFAVGLGLGVEGAILSLFVSNLVMSAAGLALLRARFSASLDLRAAVATLASALVALAASDVVSSPSAVFTLVGRVLVFSACYLTLVPALRAMTVEDFDLLGRSLAGLPLLNRPVSLVLAYEVLVARRLFGERSKDGGAPAGGAGTA